jgi:hypothetical protein
VTAFILLNIRARRQFSTGETRMHSSNDLITSDKPTSEMVRRLIPLPEQEDREGSF